MRDESDGMRAGKSASCGSVSKILEQQVHAFWIWKNFMDSSRSAMTLCVYLDLWNFTQIRNAFLRPRNGSSVLSGNDRRRMGKRNSAGVECETGSKPSNCCVAVATA